MSHNPNPFNFVNIPEAVKTIRNEDWEGLTERYSGYLTVKLQALTPLHIVGHQPGNGRKIDSSKFYRQSDDLCIPGSSIRGMLRSFIEAITCGWVSQFNEVYEKNRGERHIGFSLFDEYPDPLVRRGRAPSPPALNTALKPRGIEKARDVASWLFGLVETSQNKLEAKSVRGCVRIEDICLSNNETIDKQFPDINGDAFMGGAKPCASSWWYFKPFEVRSRHVQGNDEMAEFVGKKLRGRKFYYHQDPDRCLAWYDVNWKSLNARSRKNKQGQRETIYPDYYTYNAECLKTAEEACFRIYVHDIPKQYLALLCLCLEPGKIIRHKLGYGKAYGYGSVQLGITEAKLRREQPGDWPAQLTDHLALIQSFTANGWDNESLKNLKLDDIIHRNSLVQIAQILGWEAADDIIYSYPPFNQNNFAKPIRWDQATQAALQVSDVNVTNGTILMNITNSSGTTENKGIKMVEQFHDEPQIDIKRTIHITNYQITSNGWEAISAKNP